MKQYVITILDDGSLYDEIIFKSNEDEALTKMENIFVAHNRRYTMHLSLYFGNGRKGKMISKLNKVNA